MASEIHGCFVQTLWVSEMKTFKKVQKTVIELDEHKCDLCGDDLKSWTGFRVDMKCGYFAHCGGVSNQEEFDVCADCWEEKVVPLFAKEFGVKPRLTR